ncbi:MAG: hypothetical protein M1834_008209 [Cirrosporium novae-zelandiae]|nr:MAG: hypothetical protein M1834_008209 [Cirrosporium novae-zelandiae]
MSPPRWVLRLQAIWWRVLMRIGMFFHRLPIPRPTKPSFVRHFSATLSAPAANVDLYFYVPKDYTALEKSGKKWRPVVNFHGGGFTLGSPTDDGRWARAVLEEVEDVVFISVAYRLAPEYPFPAAVDDGVEALLWLSAHAEEYNLDMSAVALTGFSAGANLTFTVPLRLHAYVQSSSYTTKSHDAFEALNHMKMPKIKSIVAFYPALDFTMTRDERRATCCRPELTLSPSLANLFDNSYMSTPDDKFSVHLSPATATDEELRMLPNNVSMILCEYDMLMSEGKVFAKRLERLGKTVTCEVVEKVRHAWDRSPNPFQVHKAVDIQYRNACSEMAKALNLDL